MKTLHKLFATGLGSGFSPIAPGTVGSAFAGGVLYLVRGVGPGRDLESWAWNVTLLVATGLFFFAGVRSSKKMETEFGSDPSCVVIDEWVGMWIAMFWIPITWFYLLSGFLLFRVFDIWKPLLIGKAENLPGGWGIMMDDVAAGVFTNMFLQVLVASGVSAAVERLL